MPAPPIIGNIIPFGMNSGTFAAKGHSVYGDVFATTVAGFNFVFVNGQANIGRVLGSPEAVLSFGAAYEVLIRALFGANVFKDPPHKVIYAALTASRIDTMTPALLDLTQQLLARQLKGSSGVFDVEEFANETIAVLSLSMICGKDFGLERGAEFARHLRVLESDLSFHYNVMPFETPGMKRRKAARVALFRMVLEQVHARIEKLRDRALSPTDEYFDRIVHVIYYGRTDGDMDVKALAHEFGDNEIEEEGSGPQVAAQDRIHRIAKSAFGLIFAAHTNTVSTMMAHLGEVLRRPDYVEMLRRDFDEHLGADPIATFEAYLARVNAAPRDKPKEASPFMQMLDSHRILSETMRVYGRGGLWRRAMEDVELENGMVIPKGSFVTVTGHLVATNPGLYGADGDRWDPERLARPAGRRLAGDEVGQFGGKLDDLQSPLVRAADMQMAAFGAGRHLCPGRFLAYRIITQMTAQLLRGHDLEIEEAFSRWWPIPTGGMARPVGHFRVRWARRAD
ncbi:hypothetical protein HK105_204161 [Polyrhizophydium stewartii]|uniref:Cytochrome P450 n=1 Tax=Polyrhizophydium stewartii TaxID=2732419 RepID=A0ABR4NA35_9FUNG